MRGTDVCLCLNQRYRSWRGRFVQCPGYARLLVLKIQTVVSETPERLNAVNECYWRSPSTSMLTNSCGFDSRKVPEVEITWRAIRIKCEC
jgi:hypothetical protein